MDRLDDIEAFLAIIDEGSLSAAARRLGRSLQAVSRSLMALERSVGVALVHRTTRQSAPTEAGLAFYRRVKPAFGEINDARLEAANHRAEPMGVLRIGAPTFFSPVYLVPVVAAFMKRYRQIEVELKLSDKFSDLVEEELDLAIRIGEIPDSGLKARRLGELRRVAFGAPTYFAEYGRPAHPSDLTHHQCIVRNIGSGPEKWPFQVGGKVKMFAVNGRFKADSSAAVYAAVRHGLGIGFTPLWQIRELVDCGELEVILAEFETPRTPIHVVWPAARQPLAKTQLFKDFLVAHLQCERL